MTTRKLGYIIESVRSKQNQKPLTLLYRAYARFYFDN
nr:MAG TPA: hypothetical protein [Caudoviricetes sp.]